MMNLPCYSWNGGTVGQQVAGAFSTSSLGFARILAHLAATVEGLVAVIGWSTFPMTLAMANLRLSLEGASLFLVKGVPGLMTGRIGHCHFLVGRGPMSR